MGGLLDYILSSAWKQPIRHFQQGGSSSLFYYPFVSLQVDRWCKWSLLPRIQSTESMDIQPRNQAAHLMPINLPRVQLYSICIYDHIPWLNGQLLPFLQLPFRKYLQTFFCYPRPAVCLLATFMITACVNLQELPNLQSPFRKNQQRACFMGLVLVFVFSAFLWFFSFSVFASGCFEQFSKIQQTRP